ARPVPQFAVEISAHPSASPSLIAGARAAGADAAGDGLPRYSLGSQAFHLQAPMPPPITERFQFGEGFAVDGNAALSLVRATEPAIRDDGCTQPIVDEVTDESAARDLAPALASLKPLGQIRDSFILAVNPEGLWIVDQHVAHERVLFEKILKQRAVQKVESQ